MAEPHPKNAPGPFYIENECCISCGIPVDIAPSLFAWDKDADRAYDHCFVSRQPASASDLELVIEVMQKTEADCLRYRGGDREVSRRLKREGYARQCD